MVWLCVVLSSFEFEKNIIDKLKGSGLIDRYSINEIRISYIGHPSIFYKYTIDDGEPVVPAWAFNHSMLYFFEKVVLGAPVPIFPDSRILMIPNETDVTAGMSSITDTITRYTRYKEATNNGI